MRKTVGMLSLKKKQVKVDPQLYVLASANQVMSSRFFFSTMSGGSGEGRSGFSSYLKMLIDYEY